jgi:cold shock CspA family protein
MFFFHAEVTNADFNELHEGDKVRYRHGKNDRGLCAIDMDVLRDPAPTMPTV